MIDTWGIFKRASYLELEDVPASPILQFYNYFGAANDAAQSKFSINIVNTLILRNLGTLPPVPTNNIAYRNQSFDIDIKINDWFLYEMQHWAGMD